MDDKIKEKAVDESTWERHVFARNYVVLTALRGPDVECVLGRWVKSVFTRRLRGIVFTKEECRGDYTTKPLTVQELRPLEEYISMVERVAGGEYDMNLHHCLVHLFDAVKETRAHPIWGDTMPYSARILEHLVKVSAPYRGSRYDYRTMYSTFPALTPMSTVNTRASV